MKDSIKDRKFIIIFFLLFISYFVITIGILDLKSAGVTAGSMEYGFPFMYYRSNCFGGGYSLAGLLGNILFAGVLSFIFSLIIKERFTPQKLK